MQGVPHPTPHPAVKRAQKKVVTQLFISIKYGGTPLLWTPWGLGEVSCIQWNPSDVDTVGTW